MLENEAKDDSVPFLVTVQTYQQDNSWTESNNTENKMEIEFTTTEKIASLLCYCIGSIAMTLANKLLLSKVNYHINFFLLGIQNLICLVLLWGFKGCDIIRYRSFCIEDAQSCKYFMYYHTIFLAKHPTRVSRISVVDSNDIYWVQKASLLFTQ